MLKCFSKNETGKDFGYVITTPDSFDKEKESLPMIVFLHGCGEWGTDLQIVANMGIPMIFRDKSPVRAVTFSPQCEPEKVWNTQIYPLKALINEIIEEYNIDKNRVTITGMSMGGYGTWEMALSFPDFFAAIAPICGGGMAWRAKNIKNMPIRAYHGDADPEVNVRNSIEMIDAINYCGGNAELILYHNVGHNSWTNAYEHSDLIEWLYENSKKHI